MQGQSLPLPKSFLPIPSLEKRDRILLGVLWPLNLLLTDHLTHNLGRLAVSNE